MRGTIALDIDGTLTTDFHSLPQRTVDYLTSLSLSGWRLIFITGRTFSSGYKALKNLPFTYYFAVQNGATIIEMPSRRVVAKKYLDRSILEEMDAICKTASSDFVIYGGYEHDDHCYFRPDRFSPPLLNYLNERTQSFKEIWHPVQSYDDIDLELFASVKCFGLYPSARELADNIEKRLGLHVPVIRDPFGKEYYVVQATHADISKGKALLDLINLMGERGKVIAAGDDYNDVSMLAAADIKIVMATAPEELLQNADIIAPSAAEEGIIIGLEAAIKHAGFNRI